MANKSINFDALPNEVKHALNKRIIDGGHTHKELSDWLNTQGYCCSKSGMGRYCMKIKGKVNGLSPLVGLSSFTSAKHLKDIETLGQLFTHKTFIETQITTLKQAIFATETAHQAQAVNSLVGET